MPFPYVFGKFVFALICDGSSDMFSVLNDLLPWGMGIYEGVCRIHLGLFSVSTLYLLFRGIPMYDILLLFFNTLCNIFLVLYLYTVCRYTSILHILFIYCTMTIPI